MEKGFRINGPLDVAARTLESITEPLKNAYDTGVTRMRPEDVRHIKSQIRRAALALRQIGGTLKLFESLNKI